MKAEKKAAIKPGHEASSVDNRPEERNVRTLELNIRLVINRSHSYVRFMDYRVGNYEKKRTLFDELAKKERIRKIFTLVERQDSNNWRLVGFQREGVYPGFFRTADAYMMSRLYDDKGDPITVDMSHKATPDESIRFPARKLRKPVGLSMEIVEDEFQRSSLLKELNGDLRTIPFGQVRAPDVVVHAKAKQQEGWVCAEIDESFGHATVGFSPNPNRDSDLVLSAYAGHSLVTELSQRNVANLFGVSPVNDRWSNELFAGLGFRVTGRLVEHLRNGAEQSDALLWHMRLNRQATSPHAGSHQGAGHSQQSSMASKVEATV